MKTVRFAKIVERCGAPETHLVLIDPAKDRALQSAVKAQRVMTVFQENVGLKTDRGEIGFHPGPGRQFLVFRKSLNAFVGRSVIGIKYDLVSSPEVPKSQQAKASQPPKKPKPKPVAKTREEKTEPRKDNVVAFKRPPEAGSEEDEDGEVVELKKRVRHAMKVLEEGKAVAAFLLLKRIVGGS